MTAACALFATRDSETLRMALRNSGRIDRFQRTARVEEVGTPDGKEVSVVVVGDGAGSGPPFVHGWGDGTQGEFSKFIVTDRGIAGVRDAAGTRPLYLSPGRWMSTDWRFSREPGQMVAPGTLCSIDGHPVTEKEGDSAFRKADTFEEAVKMTAKAISSSVDLRTSGLSHVAVAFSGGVDSSLIALCAAKRTRVTAVTVGTKTSADAKTSVRVANELGVEHVFLEQSQEDVNRELGEVDLPFEPSPMDRALWFIFSVASKEAKRAGADAILLGQLADELFGGYAKYKAVFDKEGEMVADSMMTTDIRSCGERGFVRDEGACSRFLEPRFPFSDPVVLDAATRSRGYKFEGGVRKSVLREAAVLLGLDDRVAGSPKKAAQYSSGIGRLTTVDDLYRSRIPGTQ